MIIWVITDRALSSALMRRLRQICAPLLAAAVPLVQGQARFPEMSAVPRADLCVTEGALDGVHDPSLAVSVPKMRAYVNRPPADAAELSFTYLGPTDVHARLGSGVTRRQLGIKLRAENACNLLYVMWRIEPESKLVVSVKTNPGQQSSSECANHGYRNLKSNFSAAVPSLQPAQTHRLLAQIRNHELRAYVDGALIWQGNLNAAAAGLNGPAGVRTDNVRLEFTLSTAAASSAMPQLTSHCRTDATELE